ncbi:VOC family protein [Ferrovibrio xuzhouensis]|uniref:VOC family protein n=1 Tax=Ferrovibrio xuzhouensis TaxID=1576914 RepID=A0ABV7VPE7_9PROT
MSILGIDRITYGADDLAACRRFFLDWGLRLVREDDAGLDFESLNGCEVQVRRENDTSLPPAFEAGPTLRQVIWGAESEADLAQRRTAMAGQPGFAEADGTLYCIDPTGLGIGLRVSRKRAVAVRGVPSNTWDNAARVNTPSPVYQKAEPVEVGHVVLFTDKLAETTGFYETLGFVLSDRYPGRGHFLRCAPRGGHHDLFLLQTPEAKRGLNHVAFTVRDIHEVFGGGLHIARCGWETQLGPGRHPISSAYFWYFRNPAGALVEYYADEDVLTEAWQPRDFEPGPTVFAEWAVAGGLDGNTRRQKTGAPGQDGKFLTEKRG